MGVAVVAIDITMVGSQITPANDTSRPASRKWSWAALVFAALLGAASIPTFGLGVVRAPVGVALSAFAWRRAPHDGVFWVGTTLNGLAALGFRRVARLTHRRRRYRIGLVTGRESSATLELDRPSADRLFMEIADLLGAVVTLLGGLILFRRAIYGVRPEFAPHTHCTEAMSGGRWSAVSATGSVVSVVAGLDAVWLLAAAAGLGGLVAAYATLAQAKRRRF